MHTILRTLRQAGFSLFFRALAPIFKACVAVVAWGSSTL